VIVEWFDRGLKDSETFERTLRDVLYEPDERPSECTPRISEGLKKHIRAMNGQGWTMKNALDGVQMFGCDGDTIPGWPDTSLGCLTQYPENAEWAAPYEGPAAGSKLRVLVKSLGFNTSFWTRSSADGRFVGNGGGTLSSATVTDLAKSTEDKPFHIPVIANYDPGFMPDNSTFMYQGTRVGAGFCPQDMLLNPPMQDGQPVPITFEESGCAGADNIGTYQHLGTALDGGLSLAAKGQYTSDPGPPTYTNRNPTAAANQNATTEITPIARNGIGFKFLERTEKVTPFEGDTVVSPTGKVMSFRVGADDNTMLAVRLRLIDMEPQGDTFALKFGEPDDEWSELCIDGAKTSHSFDDRFLTIYSYGGTNGKADVYVFDLYDGQKYQVTNMPEGVYALYAHFRSDGWLYFLINDTNTGTEGVAASDIALHLYKNKPLD
jgi:hypothetical protein